MTKHDYNVVVIGAGPGGYVAAIRAAQLGLKTACVEKERTLGGTCLNVGCIPSKALLQSTEYYSWLQHESQAHGISCTKSTVDFSKMMQRKGQIVKGLVDSIPTLFKRNGVMSFEGRATFVSQNTIEIKNGSQSQKVSADHFILATGSEPIPLPFLPFDEKTVVSSTGALSFDTIPKKLAVIGGGVIGVELASVYNRLGSEVTIVEMLEGICLAMDESVSKALLQILKKQGIAFHLGCKVSKAEHHAKGIKLTVEQQRGNLELEADAVLVAVGRRPYSAGLGLQEIGIQMNRGFVNVDHYFRSSVPNIYAVGDLIEGVMLAHRASEEGVAVAEFIAGNPIHINYMAIPNVIYTHPEVAALGITEKEGRGMGLDLVIGKSLFKGNPRARCSGDTEGFVKVIGAGPDRRLVGMHIIGPHASELISEGMIAIEKRMTLDEIANSPHAHPTLSEAIKEACGQAIGSAIHS